MKNKASLTSTLARIVALAMLTAAGCRAPAGRVSSADSASRLPFCSMIFARQIVADSCIEMTYHPMRAGLMAVAEPTQHFWMVGRGAFGKRITMRLSPSPRSLLPDRPAMNADQLEHDLDEELGSRRETACVRLYPDGSDALTAVFRIIDRATSRIDVLMFQWENDPLGARMAERIAAKAAEGVRVRILIDGGGNLIFGIPARHHSSDVNGVVAQLAANPHIEVVRTRNPFGRIDHRKLVLVDGQTAWAGGRNFTHGSFFDQRDLSFTVAGAMAGRLQDEFDQFWADQGGRVTEVDRARRHDPEGLEAAGLDFIPNAQARLVFTRPMDHQIETILYRAIDRAEHHVYMENYTFCDSLLVSKLAAARRRGADVRIVLTLSDGTRALNRANRMIANRLRAAGVRVYVYPGMPHTKAAVIDGCWAYLGSGNFDPLSLRRNLEMGITLSDCPLVKEVEQSLFAPDLREGWEMKQSLPATPLDYLCEMVAGFCL